MFSPSFFLRAVGYGLVTWGISGCAPDMTMQREKPAPVPVSGAVRTLRVNASATDPAAAPARRQAAASLINQYGSALLDAPGHTINVPDPAGGSVRLSLRRGPGAGGVDPGQFASLKPTEDYRVRIASGFNTTPGAGVPLVATLRPLLPVSAGNTAKPRAVPGITWSITALPVVRTTDAKHRTGISFDLYDPRDAAPNLHLAADYSTWLAVIIAHFAPQRRGLRGFLGIDQNDFSSAGIYPTEAPTPDKTPLVLVHGLISDPTDFHDLQNRLEADPEVRRRYQIWIFYYPTSLPVPYSAMELREDLELYVHQLDPDGTHPALHRLVLVGHSMGGLLCRLAVVDGGNRYYDHFFRKPLDQLHVTPKDRDLLRQAFYYKADPDVAQVVFVATPQRGSKLTGGLLGLMGRLLVRVPLAVRTQVGHILKDNRDALRGEPLKSASSMSSLSPGDPVIRAINDLPFRPGVGLHSILGNLGRQGPRDRSTDGVVPYRSSHLPQAESEILVPAGHTGTLKRPETAAEIERILHAADQGHR